MDYAPLTRRFLAFCIDIVLIELLTFRLFLSYAWVQPLLVVAYFAILESQYITLGKWLFGIRVVRENGENITLLQGIGRTVCKLLTLPTFVVLANPVYWLKSRQALHDLAVNSYVVPQCKK